MTVWKCGVLKHRKSRQIVIELDDNT